MREPYCLQTAPAPPAPLAPPPLEWDQERADERASQAIRYLAENYPECEGSAALDSHHEAVHAAAAREDVAGYEEALRQFMMSGRREALAIRKGVA